MDRSPHPDPLPVGEGEAVSSMDEFDFIAKYFRPLAAGFDGSLNLSDDAALISPPAGCELVITKDALSAGVHFMGNESPDLIASKALRVNLSDLAAMGATPLCYFLARMLPKNTDEKWLEQFARGLKQTQDEFSIALAGGDTTATDGILSISITALGSVPKGKTLRRNGAKVGDDIYVSGTLGDAATGLLSYQRKLVSSDFFISRYLTPEPRISLGISLRDIASSAMDISDGLVQDLGHICAASNVGAIIHSDLLPMNAGVTLEQALSGGDDYELLFTCSPEQKQISGTTLIGKIMAGNRVQVLDAQGNNITPARKGYSHF